MATTVTTGEPQTLVLRHEGDRAQFLEAFRIQSRRRNAAACTAGPVAVFENARCRIAANLETGEVIFSGNPIPWELFLTQPQAARARSPRALGRALLRRAAAT